MADLEYFWIIPYYVWSSKSINGNNFEAIEAQCFAHASNPTSIYDPDRSLVDGVWYDSPDIYAARLRYKAELDTKFEADKSAYLASQGQMDN